MEDLSRYYALLKDPTRRRIIEILGSHGKIGFKELRNSLGFGVGTVYYHLDMLSDFLAQDKICKYKFNERRKMLYRTLTDGTVLPALQIGEFLSNSIAQWLFLSPRARGVFVLSRFQFGSLNSIDSIHSLNPANLEPATRLSRLRLWKRHKT